MFSMKKSKFLSILSMIIFFAQLIAEALSLFMILRLDMLPQKYTVLLIAAYVLGLLVTGLLIFPKPKRGRKGAFRRVLAIFLALLIAGLSIFAFTVVKQVWDTMQSITETPKPDGTTRQVFVLMDDPAQTLQDARDYTFGIVENYDVENTQGAILAIEQQLGQPIQTVSYTSVYDMVSGLYSGTCRAMIMNGGYVSILENEAQFVDFSEKTRILCDVTVLPVPSQDPPQEQEATEPTEEPTQEPTQEPTEPLSITERPFIMYISGSDTRSSRLSVGNSDVNILVVVNPVTKQVLMVNTPRDYYIPNPAGNGELDKLTHCGIYGIDCSIEALSDLYEIEIDYYSQINFTGFETLVDAVGGIVVSSPVTFTSGDVTIHGGENYLTGKEALVFARERHQMPGGDYGRGQNQMKVIEAIIKKVTSGTTIITNYAQILDSLQGMFVTSMEISEISQLMKMQLSDMAKWEIYSYAVSGENGRAITYSIPGLYASVMFQDQGRIDYGTELINRVMAGEIISSQDVKYPG